MAWSESGPLVSDCIFQAKEILVWIPVFVLATLTLSLNLDKAAEMLNVYNVTSNSKLLIYQIARLTNWNFIRLYSRYLSEQTRLSQFVLLLSLILSKECGPEVNGGPDTGH